ncbi:hypothetical protein [Streptomyces sp. G1]|uniref:hypothetical protein n=1 Tax=Streptomyces sp. G1 TaxID=361572 RepID=UPI00202F273C|nr:hypothetical protein [Streptomyces sp. G1]MCM1974099.1 hypothetical protein [Streptomyces sp. G1]
MTGDPAGEPLVPEALVPEPLVSEAPVPEPPVPGSPVPGPPGEAVVREALGDWRQDALLILLLPVLCWPALIGALVTRPAPLQGVLLGLLCVPVLVAVRELYVVRRVRRALRDPELRWTPYDVRVLRGHGLPPLLVLSGGSGGRGRRGPWVLTLGPLGRRVLPPRAWPRADPALPQSALPPSPSESEAADPSPERCVWLAGDPGPGAVVWAPRARELGRARRLWRRGALRRRRPPR